MWKQAQKNEGTCPRSLSLQEVGLRFLGTWVLTTPGLVSQTCRMPPGPGRDFLMAEVTLQGRPGESGIPGTASMAPLEVSLNMVITQVSGDISRKVAIMSLSGILGAGTCSWALRDEGFPLPPFSLCVRQAFGAAGLSNDFPLAQFFAGARALRFADGPDEVHRAAVAKMELKHGL